MMAGILIVYIRVIISWEITSCVIFILGVMSASMWSLVLFSLWCGRSQKIWHMQILVGAIGQCILLSFAYITSLSRLRKGKVIGAGVSGGC
jgi:hypothetical protein